MYWYLGTSTPLKYTRVAPRVSTHRSFVATTIVRALWGPRCRCVACLLAELDFSVIYFLLIVVLVPRYLFPLQKHQCRAQGIDALVLYGVENGAVILGPMLQVRRVFARQVDIFGVFFINFCTSLYVLLFHQIHPCCAQVFRSPILHGVENRAGVMGPTLRVRRVFARQVGIFGVFLY